MKVVAIIHDASSFSNSNPSGTSGSDIHELLLSLGIASPITPLTGSLSGPSYRQGPKKCYTILEYTLDKNGSKGPAFL